ncbi:glycosyltransferase [Aeromicrobium duanguangcaii]|uniref:Glycosyltransferase n=1 Tax=Aeromicrobium duanguangcaii TaxID=2968086 RepID=A0ABY5KHM7_9ACTN|nr:glycosyltransferase [Aeromicrobium duanguangcaii]MCD9154718.1 glycosyltransferase [Aeromicrobium duanguangcaii]UUI67868.1 glycosyltransferase [Aeromicrobium duanguangcaii]
MDTHDPILLPGGRQFAATHNVPHTFGGMTSALLRRSSAFDWLADTPVDVVTFTWNFDQPEIEAHLRAQGMLSERVRVRNAWYEMGTVKEVPSGLSNTRQEALGAFDPLDVKHEVRPGVRRRFSDEGRVLQTDLLRPDGSLAISDRRDPHARGTVDGRSIVLCDAEGRPVVGWSAVHEFYRAWLDHVVGGEEATFIVDGKRVVPIFADWHNPHANLVHLVHASHLAPGARRPFDRVERTRWRALTTVTEWDGFVVLSASQHADLDALLQVGDRVDIVPNATNLPEGDPADLLRDDRVPTEGVAVGSLSPRKRHQHAIAAIARLRDAGLAVSLDIYGRGPQEEPLTARITAAGLTEQVRLLGFDRAAVERFATASFFTLTSSAEGFPLVMAEGMSRGCIPIAYDIAYGPADIVEDGVSGFLVPAGDVAALAAAIERVVTMPSHERAAMRRAAVASSQRFADGPITAQWAAVFETARSRRLSRGPAITVKVREHRLSRSADGIRAEVSFTVSGARRNADVSAAVQVRERNRSVLLRAVGPVHRRRFSRVRRTVVELTGPSVEWIPGGWPTQAVLEVEVEGRVKRVILGPITEG